MALALAMSALVFAPAAANAVAPPTTTYLALGDSISFGYTHEKFNLHYPNESPSYFEEGFTNYFNTDLKKATEIGKSIRLVDDGCPGETSNGLIGETEAIGGHPSTEGPGKPQGPGDYHPCAYHFVNGLPLHNSLGTQSQLENALAVLSAENGSGGKGKVEAITLQIGSNDELAGVEECKNEIGHEFSTKFYAEQPHPGAIFALNGTEPHDKIVEGEAFQACLVNKSIHVTDPRIIENIVDVVNVLDGSGYAGPIVVEGYYNPDAFILPGSDGLQELLNANLKSALEGTGLTNLHWANPFPKFNNTKSAATEKASIAKYTEMCNPNVQEPETGLAPGCEGDIHPSVLGYKAMAKIVNEAYLAPALP
jgi:lysophospholipase L1-like esterase